MAPVVHGLEEKYGKYMNFVYLDIDDPSTSDFQNELDYNRAFRPYILFLNSDGEIIGNTLIGVQSDDYMEENIIEVLKADGVITD